jgi:acyl-CoA dehydrogenase
MSESTIVRTPPDRASQGIEDILDRMRAFMESDVYPLEETPNRKAFFELLPTLQEKRRKVKELGLWTPQVPREWGGLGLSLSDFGRVMEVLGRSPYGLFIFNCKAPDAGNIELLISHGTKEQQERFLKPLARGRDPELLQHDRARARRLEPRRDEHHGRARRRRLRDQRPQVVHLRGGRRRLRDRDGGDRTRTPRARTRAPADPRADRHARLQTRAQHLGHGPPGEGWGSHGEILYESCRVPARNLLGEEGGGVRDGPGAARAGAHPPLHALDRHLRTRAST